MFITLCRAANLMRGHQILGNGYLESASILTPSKGSGPGEATKLLKRR
jgi:hypothetical protein